MDKRYLITLTPYQKNFRLIWVNDTHVQQENVLSRFVVLNLVRRNGILLFPEKDLPYVWFKTRDKAKEYLKLMPKEDKAKIVTINYKRLVDFNGMRLSKWELS